MMWLLGAGASASAGVPTAADMTWEFKQQLLVSQRRISLQAISDLSNPVIRNRLQTHIDSLGRLPPWVRLMNMQCCSRKPIQLK